MEFVPIKMLNIHDSIYIDFKNMKKFFDDFESIYISHLLQKLF